MTTDRSTTRRPAGTPPALAGRRPPVVRETPGRRPIRVALVDDRADFRTGLRQALGERGDLVVVFEGKPDVDLIACVHHFRPDVVLIGVESPGSALDHTARLVQGSLKPPPVIVLTPASDGRPARGVLTAGIRGWLLKSTPPGQLRNAIRLVASGGAAVSPSTLRDVVGGAGDRQPPLYWSRIPLLGALTAREKDVLRLLGRGLTDAEISDRLRITGSSVRTYMSRLLTKLQLDHRTQAAIFSYELSHLGDAAWQPA
ncbi:LuxR C-terminal-related transcriptional regulator [Kitasatospora sp. NPDC059088]|uniref:LuxR C-terminal-related transcriptional regulator n=1 Tax=Kitasatospora sp. NPDC059088 TaxID=3346722 RepID=UPI0036787D3B